MSSFQISFWAAVILLGYTYVGYPLLIRAWAGVLDVLNRNSNAPGAATAKTERYEPQISILVIAHNEEANIRSKIENLLALDYPRERCEIVIASDASSDQTVARAQEYQSRGVRVVSFKEHRGKPAVLNEMIPRLSGEIVVLMDARQRIETGAVRELISNFSDVHIGAVSGELFLTDGKAEAESRSGVGFYWRYEKFIRGNESRIDSTVGVTGAIYAIQHNLFHPIPEQTILDDVLIPMQVVRKGYRVIYDSEARAWDRVSATAQAEFARKVRTIAGNYQLFFQHPWLLNPFSNRLWFQTFSHKFLRLLGPALLMVVLLTNLFLLHILIYRVLLMLQILFYSAALMVHFFPNVAKKSPAAAVAYAFCLLNAATVAGFIRFVAGSQQVTWKQSKASDIETPTLKPQENPQPGSRRWTMQHYELKSSSRIPQASLPSEIRPWGAWSVLNEGEGYKVKLIAVTPGHRLSLQYHHHRSEHWVVVAGRARVVIGDETRELNILQSADIPVGTVHRIENPYSETLIIVEVQEGEELLEEDIVRLEDDYQRAQNVRSIAK
jgi:poly-beta-1,6-N-acetyl-D-glucosamine synthase